MVSQTENQREVLTGLRRVTVVRLGLDLDRVRRCHPRRESGNRWRVAVRDEKGKVSLRR